MDADALKKTVSPICRQHSVRRLDLFGSRARGEASNESDFDFLVELDVEDPVRYAEEYFGLLHDLEDCLKVSVDLLTPGFVQSRTLKGRLQEDCIRLYER